MLRRLRASQSSAPEVEGSRPDLAENADGSAIMIIHGPFGKGSIRLSHLILVLGVTGSETPH